MEELRLQLSRKSTEMKESLKSSELGFISTKLKQQLDRNNWA